jgi:hypothetical protein
VPEQIVLSTTALVFSAGPYPAMYSDFSGIVDAATAMARQLGEGAAGVATPLLASNRSYLRIPIAEGSVPQVLCKAARRLPSPKSPPDRWGERWCDYYKSVSWNLPGAGAFVYAFAKGLLRLELPIVTAGAPGGVSVWGTRVRSTAAALSRGGTGQRQQRVAVPQWAFSRWPTELQGGFTIEVVGLNLAGMPHTLSCTGWYGAGDDDGDDDDEALRKDGLAADKQPAAHELCCALTRLL